MSKADYYRQRADECMRDVDEAPDYMKLKLLSIAQQWQRLAAFAESSEATGEESEGGAGNRLGALGDDKPHGSGLRA